MQPLHENCIDGQQLKEDCPCPSRTLAPFQVLTQITDLRLQHSLFLTIIDINYKPIKGTLVILINISLVTSKGILYAHIFSNNSVTLTLVELASAMNQKKFFSEGKIQLVKNCPCQTWKPVTSYNMSITLTTYTSHSLKV